MTIFFYGDSHGNFNTLIDAVRTYLPEAEVILGDLQNQVPSN